MTAPVYLYTGPEAGERNDAVLSVKAALKKKFGAVEEYKYYATETPAAEFMTVLQNGSLFSPATCVVVDNADAIKKKDEIEAVTSWISGAQDESAVLILVSDAVSVESKIEKAVPASNKKIFWEMFEDRKLPWLRDFFRKNGYGIAEDAAESVLDMIENNTEALRRECSRFFSCLPKGTEISQAQVEAVLAHNREESAFTLFDSMTEQSAPPPERLERALGILQKIRLSKENSSVMILAGLASCFRRLAVWHRLHASGRADDFNLKISGFSSRKSRTQYAAAARVWTAGQTAAILALIASADMAIRSGGGATEDTLLQKLLYEILMKKGAPCAAYDCADAPALR